MATHFICHSSEPLPHTFPTSSSPPKSHGAVSQYEVYNAGNKQHTQFPPPGWDFSQTSEEDSLPLIQPMPKPHWKNSFLCPDPDLCVTPQKQAAADINNSCNTKYTKPQVDPNPLLTLTPLKPANENDNSCLKNGATRDKGKPHHVRFEIDDQKQKPDDTINELTKNLDSDSPKRLLREKPYQPELYGDGDEHDLKGDAQQGFSKNVQPSTSSRAVSYTVGKVNNQTVYVPFTGSVENSTSKTDVLKSVPKVISQQISKVQTSKVKSVKVVREKSAKDSDHKMESDPIFNCIVPEISRPKRSVKIQRENQYAPKHSSYTFPFNQISDEFAGADEHMFARPEYNSTLRIKLEAEKLKASEIDVAYALQKKLTTSDATKASISEKASSHVNSDSQTFSGLISLSVPAEEICKQVVELKTVRAKQTITVLRHNAKAEPDLLEFFSSDRQKESATPTLTKMATLSEQLSQASHWRAFDLYKHNRVWDGRGLNE